MATGKYPSTREAWLAQFPQPRADRMAAAFDAFNAGGPQAAPGVIAAVESATTVTHRQFLFAVAMAMQAVSAPPASSPRYVNAVRAALVAAGLTVEDA